MPWLECTAVALGGACGCVCRYGMQLLPVLGRHAALPTLVVNLLGCLLIGLAATLIDRHLHMPLLRLACVTGFLGGFTTYSTFTLDTVTLAGHGGWVRAALYAGATLAGGICAYAAGRYCAEHIAKALQL